MNVLPLLSHELIHFLLTLSVAVFVFWKYRDFRLIIASFLTGIFIDADHLFDYLLWSHGQFRFLDFFQTSLYVFGNQKIFLPLHGWEYILPLWLLGKLLGLKLKIAGLEWALTLAYLGHLTWDSYSFARFLGSYSLIYRFQHHFDFRAF